MFETIREYVESLMSSLKEEWAELGWRASVKPIPVFGAIECRVFGRGEVNGQVLESSIHVEFRGDGVEEYDARIVFSRAIIRERIEMSCYYKGDLGDFVDDTMTRVEASRRAIEEAIDVTGTKLFT